MSSEIILQPSPEAVALAEKREQLASVRGALAEREAELAQLRTQLRSFEGRYLLQIGTLYAELDELNARIAGREAELSGSDAARRRAEESRQRAQETREALADEGNAPDDFEPPPSLKTLFREVARRIHPDFARDEAESNYFTLLMTRANDAYGRGDAETLQRLLDDHLEINATVAGEGAAAELLRITRQIRHAERDMARLDVERDSLLGSELGQLHLDAEAAALEYRDLLAELASRIRREIAEAQLRFEQLNAHAHSKQPPGKDEDIHAL